MENNLTLSQSSHVSAIAYASEVAHQVGAYPGLSFCSIKRLGEILLPTGWDASPSQYDPQH